MKFAVSYSFGKDSALALHLMKNAGHEPVCLITTINEDEGRSWFHGVNNRLMEMISVSLGIPLIRCNCNGDNYLEQFERCLKMARDAGAEACVFGDIDIEGHLEWNRKRCADAGLECILPLWKMERDTVVREIIDSQIKAVIKCVQSDCLDESFLGLSVTHETAEMIRSTGSDICGENGEYHTLVHDGPDFSFPVNIKLGEVISFGNHSAIDIQHAIKKTH